MQIACRIVAAAERENQRQHKQRDADAGANRAAFAQMHKHEGDECRFRGRDAEVDYVVPDADRQPGTRAGQYPLD